MKVSIIMPVFNEMKTVDQILQKILRVDLDEHEKEVIIVDDGSTDGTVEYLKSIKNPSIKVVFHKINLGKASAVQTSKQHVTGEVVIIQDADLEYEPNEYSKLIEPILQGKADVVYGSRYMGSSPHRILSFWHYFGNKFLTFLSNVLFNLFHAFSISGLTIFLYSFMFGADKLK